MSTNQTQTIFSAPFPALATTGIFTVLFGLITLYSVIAIIAVVRNLTISNRAKRLWGLGGLFMIAFALTAGFGFGTLYLASLRATVSSAQITYDSLFDHETIPMAQVNRISAKIISHGDYLGESWVEVTTPTQHRRLNFRFMPSAALTFELDIASLAQMHLTASGDYVR
jgi:hypothetical protein